MFLACVSYKRGGEGMLTDAISWREISRDTTLILSMCLKSLILSMWLILETHCNKSMEP